MMILLVSVPSPHGKGSLPRLQRHSEIDASAPGSSCQRHQIQMVVAV